VPPLTGVIPHRTSWLVAVEVGKQRGISAQVKRAHACEQRPALAVREQPIPRGQPRNAAVERNLRPAALHANANVGVVQRLREIRGVEALATKVGVDEHAAMRLPVEARDDVVPLANCESVPGGGRDVARLPLVAHGHREAARTEQPTAKLRAGVTEREWVAGVRCVRANPARDTNRLISVRLERRAER
jgi:phage terminase large subunit-like protein